MSYIPLQKEITVTYSIQLLQSIYISFLDDRNNTAVSDSSITGAGGDNKSYILSINIRAVGQLIFLITLMALIFLAHN